MKRLALCLFLAGAARAAEPAPRALACELLVDGFMAGGAAWVDAGHVITCAHAVPKPSARLEIVAGLTNRLEAVLVAVDLGHDLALARVKDAPPHPVARLADADPAEGEELLLLGPAMRNPPLLLPGRVAFDRALPAEWERTSAYIEAVLLAAHTPHLSSGGPWFNRRGELTGVQNGYLNNDKGAASGVALMAPPAAIRRLVKDKADAATPDLGVWAWELWTAAADHRAYFPAGQEGLILTRVFDHSPLPRDQAGRLDLLLAVNGRPVTRRHDLTGALRGVKPGDPVVLRLMLKNSHRIIECAVTAGGVEARWRGAR